MAASSFFRNMAWGQTEGADITGAATVAFGDPAGQVTAAARAMWPHLATDTEAQLRGVNAQTAGFTITITAPPADQTLNYSRIVLQRIDVATANTVTVTVSAGTFEAEEIGVDLTDDTSFTIPVGGWVILERQPGSAVPKIKAGSGVLGN